MSRWDDPFGDYAARAMSDWTALVPDCPHVAPRSCAGCDGTRQSPHERRLTNDQSYRLQWLRSFPEDRREAQADFADNVYGEMPGLRRFLVKRGAA